MHCEMYGGRFQSEWKHTLRKKATRFSNKWKVCSKQDWTTSNNTDRLMQRKWPKSFRKGVSKTWGREFYPVLPCKFLRYHTVHTYTCILWRLSHHYQRHATCFSKSYILLDEWRGNIKQHLNAMGTLGGSGHMSERLDIERALFKTR